MWLGNTTIAGTLSQQGQTRAAVVTTTGGTTILTAAQSGAGAIIAAGTLTSPATFIVPNTLPDSGAWRVTNKTLGNFPLVIAKASGLGVTVPQDATLDVFGSGTNLSSAQGGNSLVYQPLGALAAAGALPFLNGRCLNFGSSGAFDVGGTSEVPFVPTVNSFGINALFQNYLMVQFNETDNANPITVSAAFDDGTTLYPLTFAGQPSVTLGPRGSLRSDLLAITALAGVTYGIRTYVQLALPPINVAAAGSGSGGTLAAATYYFKITTLCGAQGESGGSTEVSYTASGTTSSVALSWTADQRTATPTGFNVYRGTATGAEAFLCAVGMPPVNAAGKYAWTDTGAIAEGVTSAFTASIASDLLWVTAVASGVLNVGDVITGAGVAAGTKITAYGHSGGWTGDGSSGGYTVSPTQTVASEAMTAAHAVPPSQILPLGPSVVPGGLGGTNYPGDGSGVANGTNQLTTGTGWISAGNAFVYGPTEVAGVPVTAPGKPLIVGIIGDSIEAGWNSGGSPTYDFGPMAQALIALNIPYRNMTRSGETLQSQATPARFRSRGQLLAGCTHVVIESSTNDLYLTGSTQAQVETALMTMATQAAAQGAKVLVTTIVPRVTTTDVGVTVTNQTQNGTFEPIRQAENNWRRAGCPISPTTLAPVAIGTTGAILMGQAGHPIVGLVDYCAQVEVNASNALTVNGGYWGVSPIGTAPPGTAVSGDGTHPTNPTGQTLMKAAISAALFT